MVSKYHESDTFEPCVIKLLSARGESQHDP